MTINVSMTSVSGIHAEEKKRLWGNLQGPRSFPQSLRWICSSFLWQNHNLEMLAPCIEVWKMEPTFALKELMIAVDGSNIWRLDHVDGESPIFLLDLLMKCWENATSIPQMVFWVMFYHGRSLQTTFNKSKFARVSYVSTVQPDFSPSMWITPRLGTSFAALKAFPLLEPLKKKLLELFMKLSWLFKLPGYFHGFFKMPQQNWGKKTKCHPFSRKLQQPTRAPELVPTLGIQVFNPPKNPKDDP